MKKKKIRMLFYNRSQWQNKKSLQINRKIISKFSKESQIFSFPKRNKIFTTSVNCFRANLWKHIISANSFYHMMSLTALDNPLFKESTKNNNILLNKLSNSKKSQADNLLSNAKKLKMTKITLKFNSFIKSPLRNNYVKMKLTIFISL